MAPFAEHKSWLHLTEELSEFLGDSDAPVKRKIEKHREKVLRYESILQRNPFVQPLPTSIHKKSNKKKEKVNNAQAPSQDLSKDKVGTLLLDFVEVDCSCVMFNNVFNV